MKLKGKKSNRDGIGARLECRRQAANRSRSASRDRAISRKTMAAFTSVWERRPKRTNSPSTGPAGSEQVLENIPVDRVLTVEEP